MKKIMLILTSFLLFAATINSVTAGEKNPRLTKKENVKKDVMSRCWNGVKGPSTFEGGIETIHCSGTKGSCVCMKFVHIDTTPGTEGALLYTLTLEDASRVVIETRP
jgi:hypothetical protein